MRNSSLKMLNLHLPPSDITSNVNSNYFVIVTLYTDIIQEAFYILVTNYFSFASINSLLIKHITSLQHPLPMSQTTSPKEIEFQKHGFWCQQDIAAFPSKHDFRFDHIVESVVTRMNKLLPDLKAPRRILISHHYVST